MSTNKLSEEVNHNRRLPGQCGHDHGRHPVRVLAREFYFPNFLKS
jgi:hypothetical protein